MQPLPLSGEARANSWRVFALVLFSSAYFFQSSGHNEAARFDQIRTVVEHSEWWIDRFAWNTADEILSRGHIYPDKSPGTTFIGLVPWKLTRAIFSILPIDEERQLVLLTWGLTILMSALPTALTSLLILRFLARNGWSEARATLLSVGYGLGTIAFPFATVFFGHQLAAFFAFGGFYLVWSSRWITGGRQTVRLLLSGVMIGFLPVIENPGAIASGLISLYAVATLGLNASRFVILGAVLGILPLPIYNQIAFDDPLVIGYNYHGKEGGSFPGHKLGWPRLDALRYITYGPHRGLFYANPWLIFSLLGPFFVRRVRGLGREVTLAALILICFLVFNSGFGDSFVYWGGGLSFGPRYILIALPFAVLLAAFPMRAPFLGRLIGVLIAATMLLMLPAAAIDPRLPYETSEPFMGFYLPLYARGLFSTYPSATFGDYAVFGTSGAFNLGRLIGLPRYLEVLPLTFVWAGAAFWLFKSQSRGALYAKGSAALVTLAFGLVPVGVRLSAGSVEPGLCQAISPDVMWPHFTDYALQDELARTPFRRRVTSPSLSLTPRADETQAKPSKVSMTFSGQFEPSGPGWYVFRIDTIGQAALYIDGLWRLRTAGPGQFQETSTGQVFLSKQPHELIVRYMSDQESRQLSVSVGQKDGNRAPLEAGLTSGICR